MLRVLVHPLPCSDIRPQNDGWCGEERIHAARVAAGPPPGLLGYIGERPVAWAQVGPRSELPQWNSPKTVSRPLDPADAEDSSVWAVSCFFMNSRDRGKGYSHRMLSEAVNFAKASGARILEGCPIERTKQSKSVGLYVGSLRIFEAAGFSGSCETKGRATFDAPCSLMPCAGELSGRYGRGSMAPPESNRSPGEYRPQRPAPCDGRSRSGLRLMRRQLATWSRTECRLCAISSTKATGSVRSPCSACTIGPFGCSEASSG